MKMVAQSLLVVLLFGPVAGGARHPDPNPFRHVVVIVQENRTPDNLFNGLLTWPGVNPFKYEIAIRGVNSMGQPVFLTPVPLGNTYDLSHAHSAFVAMYDGGRMDGADKIACTVGTCPASAQFKYVRFCAKGL